MPVLNPESPESSEMSPDPHYYSSTSSPMSQDPCYSSTTTSSPTPSPLSSRSPSPPTPRTDQDNQTTLDRENERAIAVLKRAENAMHSPEICMAISMKKAYVEDDCILVKFFYISKPISHVFLLTMF